MAGSRLYLDRYWREERRVADDLRNWLRNAALARDADADAPTPTPAPTRPATAGALERLFTGAIPTIGSGWRPRRCARTASR